jgi:beta-aspartyl-dipeptidase (metallo-type)
MLAGRTPAEPPHGGGLTLLPRSWSPMLTLIERGEVFAPEPLWGTSILIDGGTIIKVGEVDRRALDLLGIECEVIDAAGAVVTPGLIDPHQHLLGGSGEGGLSRQSPMLFLSEIVGAGITTAVGVLGVDTTMKTMAGLLARVKGLAEEGLTTRMWSGGYNVPPTTVMGSIREDMLFIDECVGAGEIAISDQRSLQQDTRELGRLVLDTHVGGLLSGKAGVTHFHVGETDRRLAPLRELLETFDIDPSWLYPTHVARTEALLEEAVALAREGAYVDIDVVDGRLHEWVRCYLGRGGPADRLTVSSDSGLTSPRKLFEEFRACVVEHRFPLERVLPFLTTNTAQVLKLERKGRLAVGCDADLLVLDREGLEIRDVIATGRRMVRGGCPAVSERFLEGSDREIRLSGREAPAVPEPGVLVPQGVA